MTALLFASSLCAQTLYRWKNENGVMQISDRPPPQGTAFETLNAPRSSAPSPPPAAANPTPPAGSESSSSSTPEALPAKNPELCRQARENLFWLDNRARVRVRNEEGELVFLTPAEADEQRRQAQQVIAEHCED